MRWTKLLMVLAAAPAFAAAATPDRQLAGLAGEVEQARLEATVERLVGFGTRHTLSSATDPRRGIGAAIGFASQQFFDLGLAVSTPSEIFQGARLPTPTRVWTVLAVQQGSERPKDVVIISAHLDSRASDGMDFAADAPGANDDGSGVAAVLEAARILSKRKFPATIVYALLSGEEQGLYGGKVLANHARRLGWNVVANLNNDIIGNSCGSDGLCDAKSVRVFSEGPRWQGHERLAGQLRSLGGENDSPSRNLSRFLDRLAERLPGVGLDVRQIWRNDRFGRGGDHTELLNAGYPAVRLSVAVENYTHQHQDVRVERGIEFGDTADKMDFAYLARVTRLNVAALAALASAPPPPEPRVEGAVANETTLNWPPVRGAESYVVRWRRTDASQWSEARPAPVPGLVLPGVRVDDWLFGVSSVSKDGFESPVASAVPGGAFKPWTPPRSPSP